MNEEKAKFLKRQERAKQRSILAMRIKKNRVERFKQETENRKELHHKIDKYGPVLMKRDSFPNDDLLKETKEIIGNPKFIIKTKRRR